MAAPVSAAQRFTRHQSCPVCGGHAYLPAGQGIRCYGFLSADGRYAHCTREEFASGLECEPESGTYAHRLDGPCHCGARHGALLPKPATNQPNGAAGSPRVYRDHREAGALCAYDYRDEGGEILYQVWRYEPADGGKTFKQARPVPDGWMLGIEGVRRVPYRLPELRAADPSAWVLIVEGEKDADRLAALGFVVTTNPMGAGKWRREFTEFFRGRRVCTLLDNDADGEKHGQTVGSEVCGMAKELRVLRLPGVPDKGDVSDWLDAGGTVEELKHLIDDAPAWEPTLDTDQTAESGSPYGDAPWRRRSQATNLVALARQGDMELFHDVAGKPYITFTQEGHRETWPLKSEAFRDWLAAVFYAEYGTAPGSQALQDALNTLAGAARFEGQCRPVAVRLAGHEGDIFLDLGNDAWEVVRITAGGWEIIPAAEAPVRFRRPNGLLPLPHPTRGGNLGDLRQLVNVKDDAAFTLMVAWLLGGLRSDGPYTILCLTGEQGAAKTTLARMLRSLIDPNRVPLRAEPRQEDDLLIAATNGLVVGFDNLSHLSPWLSDALCRLATGGGLSKRQLYTDAEEVLIDAQRPVLLTGIEAVLTRGDAIDRALLFELVPIAEADRRTEADIEADIAAMRPAVLGVLLDAASTALRNWSTTRPARLPRMADFARWAEAGAPAFGWEAGHFLAVYTNNRGEADEIAIDALPVGAAVRAFMAERTAWEGTATQLLALLNEWAGEAARARGWPKAGHVLSGHLKRLAPNFRRLGIEVETGVKESGGRRRLIRMRAPDQKTTRSERPMRPERLSPHDDASVLGLRASQTQAAASQIDGQASQGDVQHPRHDAERDHREDAWDAWDADSFVPWDGDVGNDPDAWEAGEEKVS